MLRISILIIFLICLSGVNTQIRAQEPRDTVKVNEKPVHNKSVMQHGGRGFVDKDGDGYNDNAPDHDGDGIPNGLDPDYQGQGKKKKFVDLDGDGIDDRIMAPVTPGVGGMNMNAQKQQGGKAGQGEGMQEHKAGKGKGKKGKK